MIYGSKKWEANRTKIEKKYRLMNKLLLEQFDPENVETNDGSLTTEVKVDMCTAEICLCMAIAKRTKANLYTKGSTFVFYQAPVNTAHYLRWADRHIKTIIEMEE